MLKLARSRLLSENSGTNNFIYQLSRTMSIESFPRPLKRYRLFGRSYSQHAPRPSSPRMSFDGTECLQTSLKSEKNTRRVSVFIICIRNIWNWKEVILQMWTYFWGFQKWTYFHLYELWKDGKYLNRMGSPGPPGGAKMSFKKFKIWLHRLLTIDLPDLTLGAKGWPAIVDRLQKLGLRLKQTKSSEVTRESLYLATCGRNLRKEEKLKGNRRRLWRMQFKVESQWRSVNFNVPVTVLLFEFERNSWDPVVDIYVYMYIEGYGMNWKKV